MEEKRYNQYSKHLKDKFGAKVYKITLDAVLYQEGVISL